MSVVSVIIPTYNRSRYILESIESILAQTYSCYEIIIVDDGSTDNTREILMPLVKEDTIQYIYQQNQGEASARNHGINVAKGKYIAFLDSDDLFIPTKLKKQVEFLDTHPEVAFVHSCYSKFRDSGIDLGYRDTSKITGKVYPDILLKWAPLIAVPSVLVRAKVLSELGGFDTNLRWGTDLDMWRRITKRYPIGVIPEVLTEIRVHYGNISGNKAAAASSFEQVLEKAFIEDPQLSTDFKRQAFANLYTNLGHNILADGTPAQMALVRKYSEKAIHLNIFQWGAYLGWLGSFLGLNTNLRDRLINLWRKYKYIR